MRGSASDGIQAPLVAAFRSLILQGAKREEAIRGVIELLTLRIAATQGFFPSLSLDRPTTEGFHRLQKRLPSLPDATSFLHLDLRPPFLHLQTIPSSSLTPRVLGEAYELLFEIPSEGDSTPLRTHRRCEGIFFTPAWLVEKMVQLANPTPDDTVCDPAMGTGFFLQGILRHLLASFLREEVYAFAEKRLVGVDRDPLAVWIARRIFWLECLREGDFFSPTRMQLWWGDTLLDEILPPCDLIIGNPPYEVLTRFSHRPDAKEYVHRLRRSGNFELSIHGQVNLYRCFIERALSILRPGGRLVFVVPAGLWLDRAATPLRRELLLRHSVDHIRHYPEDDQVFPGVTQAVTVFRVWKDRGPSRAIRYERSGGGKPVKVPIVPLTHLGEEMPLPYASKEEWALLEWLAHHAPAFFAEIAEGRVGEVDQTLYRACMLDAVADAAKATLLLRGEHLKPFVADLRPIAGKQRFLDLKCFGKEKGEAALAIHERNHHFRVAQLGIRNLQSRPRLIAAAIPPGVYCGNSVNVWWPRGAYSVDFLVGLLNSRLYDWRFCFTSGNNNINLYEVERLPLPRWRDPQKIERVEAAVRACIASIARGKKLDSGPLTLSLRDALDEAVFDLFDLPPRFRHFLKKEKSAKKGRMKHG